MTAVSMTDASEMPASGAAEDQSCAAALTERGVLLDSSAYETCTVAPGTGKLLTLLTAWICRKPRADKPVLQIWISLDMDELLF